jgi:hypothetical protein
VAGLPAHGSGQTRDPSQQAPARERVPEISRLVALAAIAAGLLLHALGGTGGGQCAVGLDPSPSR